MLLDNYEIDTMIEDQISIDISKLLLIVKN